MLIPSLEKLDRRGHFVEAVLYAKENKQGVFRERQTAVFAPEYLDQKMFFQLFDLLTKCRACDVKFLGCYGKPQVPGRPFKCAQAIQKGGSR